MPNQYENEQNVQAHFRTTGPEIWNQTQGRITHLFVSLGTCGTVTGTSSSSNLPASLAAAARWWLIAAYSSQASRLIW